MDLVSTNNATDRPFTARNDDIELNFLPSSLVTQCGRLIASYHELHGYACLPNILWSSQLERLIESHAAFRELLRKASTTRSAKKSNESFVLIATPILSLEILASNFAGWSSIFPEEGSTANAILRKHARSPFMPLMEFYLYPPKYVTSAAVAALAPPKAINESRDYCPTC
jgi:hypothetical protein